MILFAGFRRGVGRVLLQLDVDHAGGIDRIPAVRVLDLEGHLDAVDLVDAEFLHVEGVEGDDVYGAFVGEKRTVHRRSVR